MDISTTPITPDANTQRPLAKMFHGQAAKKLHGQAMTNGRIKPAKPCTFMLKEGSEPQQDVEQSKPRYISPQERTVIEFSKFCSSDFHSTDDSRSSKFLDKPYHEDAENVVTSFCSVMRLFSHTHERLFREITDTIGVTYDNKENTQETLKELIYLEKYDDISGINAARNAIPDKVKAAPRAANSETGLLKCQSSVQTVTRRFRKDPLAATTFPVRSQGKSHSEEEVNSRPIKKRKVTCQKKSSKNHPKSTKARLDAVKDTINACLQEPTSKKDIEFTINSIFSRGNHWKNLTSLRTSLRRWFYDLNPSMTQGFKKEEIKQAEEVFARLMGVYPSSGTKTKT
ncbi:hypothetical protein [Endozoicomonas sp. GU-1]|uniref:hypothetical protein n=1 Tax=Endozoicomonas sp. GU-1 TaxID=3009078 RepID=UPI0022B49112|nr:hypothetical protein [Endozoicomonas sp. GU-1]WBA80709.1 hypothetical protein O2T12_20695 [Endozoicomonas sp. GU-1]WBA88276.1 hypothetical protein O3276_09915 [Endozoicomonas sp. GU-1]